jgi:hypothetical protein
MFRTASRLIDGPLLAVAVVLVGLVTPATAVASPTPVAAGRTAGVEVAGAPGVERSRILSLTALPSADSERERLRAAFRRADFQPIGFHIQPGRPLTVHAYPSGARGGSTLELMVGIPGLVEHDSREGLRKEPRTYSLNTGGTRIADPLGGVLSVRYVVDGADGTRPAPRVVVTLGATAEPIPFYTTDNADENRWRRTLDQTTSPYAQLVSARTIVTARTTTIRSHVRQDPRAVLDAYDGIVGVEEEISGLDGTSPTDRPTPLRHSVVEGAADGSPYAYDQIVSFPAGDNARLWLTPAGLAQNWGAWHEIGHHHQQETWDWSAIEEVSVNLYALAVHQHHKGSEDSHGHATVQEWEGAKAFLDKVRAEDLDYNRPLGEDDIYWYTLERLVMFEQLRVIFGESFYRALHKIGRTRDDDVPDIDKQRFFMITSSRLSGTDLTDFFDKWGWRRQLDADGGRARREIADLGLPVPDVDLSRTPVYGASR